VTAFLDDGERRAVRVKARTAILEALRTLGGEAEREAILAHARSHGGFTERVLAAPPPAKGASYYSSLIDHQLSWALTNLRRDGLVEKPKRGIWELTDAGLFDGSTAVSNSVDTERLAELRAMPYHLYLRTPEWRRARATALMRSGYACSLDVNHTEGLEVHHRTYENRGAERAADLIVLCHACHQLHHTEYGRPRRESSTAPRALSAAKPDLAPSSPGEAGKTLEASPRRRFGEWIASLIGRSDSRLAG
jgi:hypothetical protein